MHHYKYSTQTPNIIFDTHLKHLTLSELKVLLTIIRKTIGQVDPSNTDKRKKQAWISQRLFMLCCNLSGKAVSRAIDSLIAKELIVVKGSTGKILHRKQQRRRANQLFFSVVLGLPKKPETQGSCKAHISTKGHKAMAQCHTIKLRYISKYSEPMPQVETNKSKHHHAEITAQRGTITQNIRRQTDWERYREIQAQKKALQAKFKTPREDI